MDTQLESLASAQGGLILTAQAMAAGMTADRIHGWVERGTLLALRKGVLAVADAVPEGDERARHRLDVSAALLSYGGEAALRESPRLLAGHRSAAVLWGLPAPRLAPVRPPSPSARNREPTVLLGAGTVELVNTDRARRSTRHGVRIRPATVPPEHVAWLEGVPLTSRARTAVDVARLCGYRQGVQTADAALNAGETKERLLAAAEFCRHWPGGARALRAAKFADARAQSPAESLARIILDENGFPAPELQVPIYDESGTTVLYYLDIVVCRWVDIEPDGKIKYTQPWAKPGDVLWNEKLREDYVRDLGYEVVRTNWDELNRRPRDFLSKVERAAARADRVVR